MKKLSFLLFISLVFQLVDAQHRADLPSYYDYRGPVVNEEKPTVALPRAAQNVGIYHGNHHDSSLISSLSYR